MGKINQGILGKVSGRVGSVVGASWKGLPTLRVYQPDVANPKTAAQTAQRSAFKAISEVGSQLLNPLIKSFWDRFAVKESGYNAFVKANKATGGGFFNTPATIVFSKGVLGVNKSVAGSSLELSAEKTGNTPSRYDLDTDEVYAIAYNADLEEYASVRCYTDGTYATPATRSASSYYTNPADFPSTWNQDAAPAYAAMVFRRADGSYVSDCKGLSAVL